MQTFQDKTPLAGRRVLIVKDEYFVADDLAQVLHRFRAEIVGPAAILQEALGLLMTEESIDLAVLDINLRGETVFPVAAMLIGRGVRFLFATGYGRAAIPAEYRHVPCWEKPFAPASLAQALGDLLSLRSA